MNGWSVEILGRRYITFKGVSALRAKLGMPPPRPPEPGETIESYKTYATLVRRETLRVVKSLCEGTAVGPKEWSPRWPIR
jgi:hypothetical protein